LNSDVLSIVARHDPSFWASSLIHRAKVDLPFDASQLPEDAPLLFDTTVYIDQLKGELPNTIVSLMSSRPIFHASPALAELAVTVGVLNPTDQRSKQALLPITETLARIPLHRVISPSNENWLEAAVIVGILARTQGIAKEARRKILNDTLLFLMAADNGLILISRNTRDIDLLLQMKHRSKILFYDRRIQISLKNNNSPQPPCPTTTSG
jgi:predicted nucleic acid-binding protein